jgi:hypothetical protein
MMYTIDVDSDVGPASGQTRPALTSTSGQSPEERISQMFFISQSAVESVLQDMRTGADADFVADFFANRPEWSDDQEDDEQEEENED